MYVANSTHFQDKMQDFYLLAALCLPRDIKIACISCLRHSDKTKYLTYVLKIVFSYKIYLEICKKKLSVAWFSRNDLKTDIILLKTNEPIFFLGLFLNSPYVSAISFFETFKKPLKCFRTFKTF